MALQRLQKAWNDAKLGQVLDMLEFWPRLIPFTVEIEQMSEKVAKDDFPRIAPPVIVLGNWSCHGFHVKAKLACRRYRISVQLGHSLGEENRFGGLLADFPELAKHVMAGRVALILT